MNTIYKYPFNVTEEFTLELPKDSYVLTVMENPADRRQDGDISMWVALNTDKPLVTRKFRIYGTGHNLDKPENLEMVYIKTFYQANFFVWHLFEVV